MQADFGEVENRHHGDNGIDQCPELLILNLYDLGIQFCAEHKRHQARKVLVELINALNFEYADMAASFYNLYQFALNQVETDNYDQALEIFQGLRSAWEQLIPGDMSKAT